MLPPRTCLTILALCFCALPVRADLPGEKDQVTFWLTLFHTNDALSSLSYSDRWVGLLRQSRAEAKEEFAKVSTPSASILLSSGGNFFPSFTFNAGLEGGFPIFDTRVLSAAKFDVIGLANFDFTFGSELLHRLLRGVNPRRTTFLSANVIPTQDSPLRSLQREGRLARSTILVRKGVKIGVIGTTLENAFGFYLAGDVEARQSIISAVREETAHLQRRGADIIILLSNQTSLDNQRDFIAKLRNIDIVVGSGEGVTLANKGDSLFEGDVAAGPYPMLMRDLDGLQVPFVTTYGHYIYLGRLQVGFNAKGEVAQISGKSGPLNSEADDVEPAKDVTREVVRPLQPLIRQYLARHLADVQGELTGSATENASEETNLGDLVADALLHQGRSAARGGKAPRPDVTLVTGDSFSTFDPILKRFKGVNALNVGGLATFLVVIPDIPPTQLKQILEHAVSNASEPSGEFMQVAGLRFTYRLNGRKQRINAAGKITQSGNRIREVRLSNGKYLVRDGQVVQGAPSVSVATLDYNTESYLRFPFQGREVISTGIILEQAIYRYVENLGVIRSADYPVGGQGRITRLD